MSLNLETESPATIEIDHTGIVFENRKAPRLIQLLSCFHDCVLKQIIYSDITILDSAFESLVDAVFRPGLRQCLKFNIGRVAHLAVEMAGDCFKLVIGKSKSPSDRLKPDSVCIQKVYLLELEFILGAYRKACWLCLNYLLNDRVHQQSRAYHLQLIVVELPFNKVAFSSFDCFDTLDTQIQDRLSNSLF